MVSELNEEVVDWSLELKSSVRAIFQDKKIVKNLIFKYFF